MEIAGTPWVDVVDVPLGTRIGDVLRLDDAQAVLIGGYAGTWVEAGRAANLRLDRGSLAAGGRGPRRGRARRAAGRPVRTPRERPRGRLPGRAVGRPVRAVPERAAPHRGRPGACSPGPPRRRPDCCGTCSAGRGCCPAAAPARTRMRACGWSPARCASSRDELARHRAGRLQRAHRAALPPGPRERPMTRAGGRPDPLHRARAVRRTAARGHRARRVGLPAARRRRAAARPRRGRRGRRRPPARPAPSAAGRRPAA